MELKDFNMNFHDAGSEMASFSISDRDEPSAGASYYGMVSSPNKNGEVRWLIMKEETSGDVTSTRYTSVGTDGYTTAWTNRASQTYAYFYEI